MIETFGFALGVVGVLLLGLLLNRCRELAKCLDDLGRGLDGQRSQDVLDYTSGICFIDNKGNIGSVSTRRTDAERGNLRPYYIPDFLRR